MRGPARLATHIGIGMILGGFALIGLAWNGAAGLGYIQGQFPYLLSGGLAGLGLIAAGSGVLFVQTLREIDAAEAHHYERVVDSVHRVTASLRGGSPAPMAAVAAPAASGTVRVVPAATQTAPVSQEAWAPPADEQGLVVAGRSSFHDPSCHLVSGRGDLDLIARDEAVESGLKPCRVCKP